MQVDLIRIGNSKGFRLPAAILKEFGLSDTYDLSIENNAIILRPIRSPRQGWSEAFKKMHENSDDTPLIDDTLDISEDWEWK